MVAIQIPISKGTVYTPVTKTCRVATERGMIRTPCCWTRINDISSLWPDSQFRAVAIAAAERFVADMARQGNELLTSEASVLVYGPIRHRDFSVGASSPTWTPAPGASPTFQARGFAFNDEPESASEDFLLRAEFLASKVHLVEYTIKDTDA